MQLEFETKDFAERAVSPFVELGAYEALWDQPNTTFKTIAELFAKTKNALPSDFIEPARALKYAAAVNDELHRAGVKKYGIRIHGAGDYPDRLRDADHPLELLYFRGWWELVNSPRSIAVVGSRNPSSEAVSRTRRLVRALLEDDFTIVSGLAAGIDTMAHTTAIQEGGRTIAVLGTPLSRTYPAANASLQNEIAEHHLLVSQVPIRRYANQPNPKANNFFFPERNVTMSALTDATIIVEAGDTSGTLIQARHALKQGRKLFILANNFMKPDLKWPHSYEEKGAIKVNDYADIKRELISITSH